MSPHMVYGGKILPLVRLTPAGFFPLLVCPPLATAATSLDFLCLCRCPLCSISMIFSQPLLCFCGSSRQWAQATECSSLTGLCKYEGAGVQSIHCWFHLIFTPLGHLPVNAQPPCPSSLPHSYQVWCGSKRIYPDGKSGSLGLPLAVQPDSLSWLRLSSSQKQAPADCMSITLSWKTPATPVLIFPRVIGGGSSRGAGWLRPQLCSGLGLLRTLVAVCCGPNTPTES